MAMQEEKKLVGKVALVTGARLAAEGAKVAITYSKGAEAAASVVKSIEKDGGKAIAIQADASDANAVKNAV